MTPAACACLCEELKLGNSYRSAVFSISPSTADRGALYLRKRQSPAGTQHSEFWDRPGELFVPYLTPLLFSGSTGSQNVLPTTASPTWVIFPFGFSILSHLCVSHPLEKSVSNFTVCARTYMRVVYVHVCMFQDHSVHVEVRRWTPPYFEANSLLFTATYVRPGGPQTSRASPVSASLLLYITDQLCTTVSHACVLTALLIGPSP